MKYKCPTIVSQSVAVFLAVVSLGVTPSLAAITTYTDFTSFDAVTSTILVEDFENVAPTPTDTALGSFSNNGNTYIGMGGTNVWVASPGYVNFGTPETTTSILTATGDEDFRVDLGSPSNAVGFDVYTNGYAPATVTVTTAQGEESPISLAAYSSSEIGFLGISSTSPILGFRFTTTQGRTINTGIDNLRQESLSTVPAPGAFLLAGLGTGLVSYMRRRRSI